MWIFRVWLWALLITYEDPNRIASADFFAGVFFLTSLIFWSNIYSNYQFYFRWNRDSEEIEPNVIHWSKRALVIFFATKIWVIKQRASQWNESPCDKEEIYQFWNVTFTVSYVICGIDFFFEEGLSVFHGSTTANWIIIRNAAYRVMTFALNSYIWLKISSNAFDPAADSNNNKFRTSASFVSILFRLFRSKWIFNRFHSKYRKFNAVLPDIPIHRYLTSVTVFWRTFSVYSDNESCCLFECGVREFAFELRSHSTELQPFFCCFFHSPHIFLISLGWDTWRSRRLYCCFYLYWLASISVDRRKIQSSS